MRLTLEYIVVLKHKKPLSQYLRTDIVTLFPYLWPEKLDLFPIPGAQKGTPFGIVNNRENPLPRVMISMSNRAVV